jgi:hypothetical protein
MGVKVDFAEIGWEGVEWIHLAQVGDRWRASVSTVMNLRVLAPRNYIAGCLVCFYVACDTIETWIVLPTIPYVWYRISVLRHDKVYGSVILS